MESFTDWQKGFLFALLVILCYHAIREAIKVFRWFIIDRSMKKNLLCSSCSKQLLDPFCHICGFSDKDYTIVECADCHLHTCASHLDEKFHVCQWCMHGPDQNTVQATTPVTDERRN